MVLVRVGSVSRQLIISNTNTKLAETQTSYKHRGKTVTLRFRKLKYKRGIEGKDNLENVKTTKDEDGLERMFKLKRKAYSSFIRTLDTHGNWNSK